MIRRKLTMGVAGFRMLVCFFASCVISPSERNLGHEEVWRAVLKPHGGSIQHAHAYQAHVEANEGGLANHSNNWAARRISWAQRFRDEYLSIISFITWFHCIPIRWKPPAPFKESKPLACKRFVDCSLTRDGIGRRGVWWNWLLSIAVFINVILLVVVVTSMKPQNQGKLTIQSGKAAIAMVVAALSSSTVGYCLKYIFSSSSSASMWWLLAVALLDLPICVASAFWFIDVEVAMPHLFTANVFMNAISILELCLLLVVNYASIFLQLVIGDARAGNGLLSFTWQALNSLNGFYPYFLMTVLPRNVALLLWDAWNIRDYIYYFYWWGDTTGEALWPSDSYFFLLVCYRLAFVSIQLCLPYSRDRYFVGAFGYLLNRALVLGMRGGIIVDRTDQHALFEILVLILVISIVTRYQVTLPPQLQKVKYVRLRYLYRMRATGQKIKRCQELPESAFGNPAKAVHLIIVSHHWLDGHSCDVATPECPEGLRLSTICQRLERYFPWDWPGCSEIRKQPMSTFWAAILSANYCCDDILVFFDFMSLPQIGVRPDGTQIQRTTEEAALFNEILPACGLLYTMFPVLVVPEVCEGVSPYMESGWCFCEFEQAQLCGTLSPYSENVLPATSHAEQSFDVIERELGSKGFRCESDRDVVCDIVKGTWIRRHLLTAVVAQDTGSLRSLLNQLSKHNLQMTINFPVDSSSLDTLLHVALAKRVSAEVKRMLVDYGADAGCPNHRGETPGQWFIFPRSCSWNDDKL